MTSELPSTALRDAMDAALTLEATGSDTHRAVEKSDTHRRGGPYRQLQRWIRHTPTGDLIAVMLSIGIALVFIAIVVLMAT